MKKKMKKVVGSHLRTNRATAKINSKMRVLVLKRVKELGLSRYAVAKLVAPHVSRQAVYGYLAARRDMTSGLLWHLLAALGLEVKIKKR